MDKEWEVEFTIEGKTSFFCDTKEEAEKKAHDYLSELCQSYELNVLWNKLINEIVFSIKRIVTRVFRRKE